MTWKIDVVVAGRRTVVADVVAVFVPQSARPSREDAAISVAAAIGRPLTRLFADAAFGGEAERTLVVHPALANGPKKIVFVGLGKPASITEESMRRAGVAAMRAAGDAPSLAIVAGMNGLDAEVAACAIVEGALLGAYRFEPPLAKPRRIGVRKLRLVAASTRAQLAMRAGARRASAVIDGVTLARDLANLPANHCPPSVLARAAQAAARVDGVRCRVLDEPAMKRLRMGSLLCVSKGSIEPPRMIIMEHGRRRAGRPTFCIVGKGVTFDSGGISIKPAGDMDKMRYDKCGATAVIGLMRAVARMKLPLHVVGIVPTVENMPSGTAVRPGDVVRAMNGKTIEVLNTDAEGRLILADALAYSARFKPEHTIDLATLTGACVATFGSHVAAMLGTDEAVIADLSRLGEDTRERVWRLPLTEDYEQMVRGTTADLKNLGGPRGGTITAAAFLKPFVDGRPWVHLDIAGVAYDDPQRPYNAPAGATGFGVRLLARLLCEHAGKPRRRR